MGAALLATVLGGCADVGGLRLDLSFPDGATQAETRRLEVIARQPPATGTGCDDLWSTKDPGRAESIGYVDYPNPVDILATGVRLDEFPALTIIVRAYPAPDTTAVSPVAGACQEVVIDQDHTASIDFDLEPAPGH